MREFDREKRLSAVICNGCGRKLKMENGELREGCFFGKQTFGYFSTMDGEEHRFELCEDCYRKLAGQFRIPPETRELTELL